MQAPKPRLHRAPLVLPAGAMVLGIICGRFLPPPMGAYLLLASIATVGAAACFFAPHLRRASAVLALVAAAGLGGAYVRWAYFDIPADDIVHYTDVRQTLATLDGRIVTTPQVVSDGPDSSLPYRRPDRTIFMLQVGAIDTPRGQREVSGMVRVTVAEPARTLAAGDSVRVVCWIGRYGPPRNPGQFDQQAWSRTRHTLVWASVPSAQGVIVQDSREPNWLERAYWNVRAATRQHLDGLGEPQNGHLVNALVIGERHQGLERLNQAMMKAGVAHYLAISGGQLAIFLGFFYLVCRLFAMSTRRSAAVAIVVLAAYMLLAEPCSPLYRSAIMAGAVALAAIIGRRASSLNALAAACIVLLAADPLDLFSAGFQLSFGIVLGLVVLSEPIRQALFGRFLRRRGLMVFRGDQRIRRAVYYNLANWAMGSIAMSTAAFVVSVPLVAYHFGMFNPYAGVLTAILALPVAMVLVSGHVSLAMLWPMPNLSQHFGAFSAWSAGLLEQCVQWAQHLPGLCIPMRPLSPWWVVLCYAMVTLWLLRRRIPRAGLLMATAALALAGWTVQSQLPAAAPAQAQAHVLAVGAGQCVVLHSPSGKTYIFDAGTRSAVDVYTNILAPFLREKQLPTPECVFVSHADADHYNALLGLLAENPPRKMYLSNFFETYKQEPHITELMTLAAERRVAVDRLQAGQEFALDEHVRVKVLWPPTTLPAGTVVNDTSLALRVECDGTSILFAGDAMQVEEGALLENLDAAKALASDAMILPHHGGFTPATEKFVQAVAARVVIVSSSHDPAPVSGEKPGAAFYQKLRQSREVRETWKEGCLRVQLGKGKVEVESER